MEIQLMNLCAQGVENDGPGGNRQGIFSWLGSLLGEINQHAVAHIIHVGAPALARGGVGERSLHAILNLAHGEREIDDEVLQALHLTLGRVDGDLLVERLGSNGNDKPERDRQQTLAIDGECKKVLLIR